MIFRSALARGGQLALRRHGCASVAQRGFATAVSDHASYESTNVAGIQVASRDDHGPTTRLALVAKGGTRYQPVPGVTVGLEEFAFKSTSNRSALRIIRETELLGGQLDAYHTREALVVQASFLRPDLPYFAELLAEVISATKYSGPEFHEEVESVIHQKQARINNVSIALDAAHSVAFHRGLGEPLYPTTNTPIKPFLSPESIAEYATWVWNKPNIALVADGASHAELSKWTESFFKAIPAQLPVELQARPSKYHGGEQRIPQQGKNVMVVALPGVAIDSNSPEVAVLSALLGGRSNVKWAPGFTLLAKVAADHPGAEVFASHHAYSDAGLLTIQVSGFFKAVAHAVKAAVEALKSVAEKPIPAELLTKAIAKAKFNLLSGSETGGVGLVSAGTDLIHGKSPVQVAEALKSLESVTVEKLQTATKSLLEGKASVSTVGDLFALPFAEELGLKV